MHECQRAWPQLGEPANGWSGRRCQAGGVEDLSATAAGPTMSSSTRAGTSPRWVTDGHGYVLGADGEMLSKYPIDIFDRVNNPRWPPLGVKLSAKTQVSQAQWSQNANPIELARSLLETLLTPKMPCTSTIRTMPTARSS